MSAQVNGTAETSTALVLRQDASTALEPTSIDEAFRMCETLVKSGLLGKNIQRPEAAFAILVAGRELGLTAMQSLRSIHIIEGKPTLAADLMVALVKRSPVCNYFKLIESTDTIATYATDRRGEGETRMSFTWDEAVAAGVTGKQNWRTYPKAMLRARCIAALARAVFPDLLMGIYETDELSREPVNSNSRPVPIRAEVVSTAPTETMAAKGDRWVKILGSAETPAQLKMALTDVRAELESLGLSDGIDELKVVLNDAYAKRKTDIAAAVKARKQAEAVPAAEDAAREPGEDDA